MPTAGAGGSSNSVGYQVDRVHLVIAESMAFIQFHSPEAFSVHDEPGMTFCLQMST